MKAVEGGDSLVAQVGARLRAAIEHRELEPGQLYSVIGVAAELGVSRTPVREALLGLAEAGLVRVERNRGFTVVQPSSRQIRDVFEVRTLLEAWAARAAASAPAQALDAVEAAFEAMAAASRSADLTAFAEHDVDFHHAVLLAAGNPFLTTAVQAARDAVLALGVSTAGHSRTTDEILEEHRPILVALRAADADAAESSMRSHLEHTRDLMVGRAEEQERDGDAADPAISPAAPGRAGS